MMRTAPGPSPDEEDAFAAARRLGIPFRVEDLSEEFSRDVIEPFCDAYFEGLTPNPCVFCNKKLKFGALFDMAMAEGSDYFATGHYVRAEKSASGRSLLRTALDLSKDQSYVLWSLTQERLARCLFPLGELDKQAVREIARSLGLVNSEKADSQDVCFIPDGDYPGFILRHSGRESPEGDFVDGSGAVVGRHRGLIRYTVGQRRGLRLPMGERVYVIEKDAGKNRVILGNNEDLMKTRLRAEQMNYIAEPEPSGPRRLAARIRYNQKSPVPATLFPEPDGFAVLEFDSPVRAAAPGQSVVLYDGEYVHSGGIIL